jgi:FMN phosphatase YigB (HAD superfamily)
LFIDPFDIILLDQARTFMFGVDRFGPETDFASTYTRIGGGDLGLDDVNVFVTAMFGRMVSAYDDRNREDRFPTVAQAALEAGLNLSAKDVFLLDDLFAEHEIGSIPESHCQAIHKLSKSHRLGIISNIWAQPARFEHNLQNAGIFDCFEHIVWSSLYGKSKPSKKLFTIALDYWNLPPDRILYVGDDPVRDVTGAQAVGMGTAWINAEGDRLPEGCAVPDVIISSLPELLEK